MCLLWSSCECSGDMGGRGLPMMVVLRGHGSPCHALQLPCLLLGSWTSPVGAWVRWGVWAQLSTRALQQHSLCWLLPILLSPGMEANSLGYECMRTYEQWLPTEAVKLLICFDEGRSLLPQAEASSSAWDVGRALGWLGCSGGEISLFCAFFIEAWSAVSLSLDSDRKPKCSSVSWCETCWEGGEICTGLCNLCRCSLLSPPIACTSHRALRGG